MGFQWNHGGDSQTEKIRWVQVKHEEEVERSSSAFAGSTREQPQWLRIPDCGRN